MQRAPVRSCQGARRRARVLGAAAAVLSASACRLSAWGVGFLSPPHGCPSAALPAPGVTGKTSVGTLRHAEARPERRTRDPAHWPLRLPSAPHPRSPSRHRRRPSMRADAPQPVPPATQGSAPPPSPHAGRWAPLPPSPALALLTPPELPQRAQRPARLPRLLVGTFIF